MTRLRCVVLGLLAGASSMAAIVTAASADPSAAAVAAVTPGWECVPTTAGQPVVSGGTGTTPSCAGSTTPVLAPTYVASGVGGKPTVELSSVNLQVVDGAGSTSSVNGTGNVVIGYAENPKGKPQTGSHDLILGTQNAWSSYADVVGGHQNNAKGPFEAVFGSTNVVSGASATIAGGEYNNAGAATSAILGGCGNLTGPGSALNPACSTTGDQSIAGGVSNRAEGLGNTVAGGDFNTANGTESSIAGGEGNLVSQFFSTIAGGQANTINGGQGNAIAGGLSETVSSGDQLTKVGANSPVSP